MVGLRGAYQRMIQATQCQRRPRTSSGQQQRRARLNLIRHLLDSIPYKKVGIDLPKIIPKPQPRPKGVTQGLGVESPSPVTRGMVKTPPKRSGTTLWTIHLTGGWFKLQLCHAVGGMDWIYMSIRIEQRSLDKRSADMEAIMPEQSRMHFYLNWAKERIDEMDATLASLDAKVCSQWEADLKVKANQLIADLE